MGRLVGEKSFFNRNSQQNKTLMDKLAKWEVSLRYLNNCSEKMISCMNELKNDNPSELHEFLIVLYQNLSRREHCNITIISLFK